MEHVGAPSCEGQKAAEMPRAQISRPSRLDKKIVSKQILKIQQQRVYKIASSTLWAVVYTTYLPLVLS